MKREPDLNCKVCNLSWTPARCTGEKPNGSFGPVNLIRCVECKSLYNRDIDSDNLNDILVVN